MRESTVPLPRHAASPRELRPGEVVTAGAGDDATGHWSQSLAIPFHSFPPISLSFSVLDEVEHNAARVEAETGVERQGVCFRFQIFDTLANYFGSNPCLGRICRFMFEASRSTKQLMFLEE